MLTFVPQLRIKRIRPILLSIVLTVLALNLPAAARPTGRLPSSDTNVASQPSRVPSTESYSKFDVVFDLDGTLINPTTPELAAADPKGVIVVNDKFYRFTDHAFQVIESISLQPNVRVSFFSGGDADRNLKVINLIYDHLHAKNPKLMPYKVLSFDDLTVVDSGGLRFSQRYKKDLSRFFDLSSTLLVDDNRQFAMPGQEKNMLWLGRVYHDIPRYEFADQIRALNPTQFDLYPTDEAEWRRERNKLVPVVKTLLEALKTATITHKSLVETANAIEARAMSCSQIFAAAP